MKLICFFLSCFFLFNVRAIPQKNSPISINKKIKRTITSDPAVQSKEVASVQNLQEEPERIGPKSQERLLQILNNSLNDLKSVCNLKTNQRPELQNKMQNLITTLERELKDPNMIYSMKLIFGDILDAIKRDGQIITDFNRFQIYYKVLFNLPNIEVNEYPDSWARDIYKALECANKELSSHLFSIHPVRPEFLSLLTVKKSLNFKPDHYICF